MKTKIERTVDRKFNTTVEMLSKLEKIMLLDEFNSLPFGEEFYEKVAIRKKVTDVLNYLTENK
jgi:hypothetical protein